MFKSTTLLFLIVVLFCIASSSMQQKDDDYGKSKPQHKKQKCKSCHRLLDDITVTSVLGCRDRVASKYYDLVQVPNVIVDLLRPEMDICLNGPVHAEADPDTYPGTNDYLVEAFVNAFSDPDCREALNRTVILKFKDGKVNSVKLILKEDLPK